MAERQWGYHDDNHRIELSDHKRTDSRGGVGSSSNSGGQLVFESIPPDERVGLNRLIAPYQPKESRLYLTIDHQIR